MTQPRNLALLLGGERGLPAGALQALLHPPFLPGAGEVGQLGADVGAVRGVQDVHELPEAELRRAEQRIGGECPVEIRLREPVCLRMHVRGAGPAVDLVHVQRVDVRDAEAAVAVGADEAVDRPVAVGPRRAPHPAWPAHRPRSPGGRVPARRRTSSIRGRSRMDPTDSVDTRLPEMGRWQRRAAYRSCRTVRGGGSGPVGSPAVYRIGFRAGYPRASALCEHARDSMG